MGVRWWMWGVLAGVVAWGCGGAQGVEGVEGSGAGVGEERESVGNVAPERVGEELTPEALQAGVRAVSGEMTACYRAALEEDSTLEGQVVMRALVGEDGRVGEVEVGESELPEEVGACVAEVMGGLDFGGWLSEPVWMVWPFRFTPGTSEVMCAGAQGEVDVAAVEAALGEARAGVEACVQEALGGEPVGSAVLRVRVRIGEAGEVEAVELRGEGAPEAVRVCVHERMGAQEFPAAVGGAVCVEQEWRFEAREEG